MMLMIRMRLAFALLLGLMLAANVGSVAAAAPSLAATPVVDVLQGTSTITWDTGDGSVGQVYVAVDYSPNLIGGFIGEDRLFAQNPSGSQDAPWINYYGYYYRFSLYAGLTHTTLLKSLILQVTFSQRLTATPNPVPAGTGLGTTRITFGTPARGLGGGASVFVSMDGGKQALFTAGSGGEVDAPWIQTGHTYVFSAYDSVDINGNPSGSPVKSITVTRQG